MLRVLHLFGQSSAFKKEKLWKKLREWTSSKILFLTFKKMNEIMMEILSLG